MPPLQPDKNRNLLYIGIIAAVIIVVIAAVAGYLYVDDQNKQRDQQREDLKQAFTDQLNETGRQYALIGGYAAPGNKNYLDEFRTWIDGYRQLAGNYSLAIAQLAADGAAYQAMLVNDSGYYVNVTLNCSTARDRLKAINDTAAGYEKEYQTRLGLMDIASADYSRAVDQSHALYGVAWNYMQESGSHTQYGTYHAYLILCDQNNTNYNNSIRLVENAGAAYQAYLKGSDYFDVNATIQGLYDNATKLGRQNAELLKLIPYVNVTLLGDQAVNINPSSGMYVSQAFSVQNNGWPMKISNVVVHFQLIDRGTGQVRSTSDVNVKMAGYTSDLTDPGSCWVNLPCDQNHNYDIKYTISYEY